MVPNQHNPSISLAHSPGFRVLAQTDPLVVGVCLVETVVQEMRSVAGTFLAVGQTSKKKKNKQKTKLAMSSGKNALILQVQVHRVNTGDIHV